MLGNILFLWLLSETNNEKGIKESELVYEEGDFESVCNRTENEIINQIINEIIDWDEKSNEFFCTVLVILYHMTWFVG